jgi:hypothetical protein
LATPEPEIPAGNPSHIAATSSDQATELLLKQLMTEMKNLRERVDAFPTGPVQGVAAGLQTLESKLLMTLGNLVPSHPGWKLMNRQCYCVSPRTPSLFNPWRPAHCRQAFRFPRWCTFVRSSGNMFLLRFQTQ